jgi:hypothetical protein
MKNIFLLKLLKTMLRTATTFLTGSLKFALQVIFDDKLNKQIKANRKKRNEYDDYVKAFTKRKSF